MCVYKSNLLGIVVESVPRFLRPPPQSEQAGAELNGHEVQN